MKKYNDLLEGVNLIHSSDFWDGPLYGLCEYNNKIHRFETEYMGFIEGDNTSDDPIIEEPRLYVLKEILPWQLAYELYWAALFSTNVKSYTEFDKGLIDERHILYNEEANFGGFYEKYENEHKDIDYTNNKIIGYFEKL